MDLLTVQSAAENGDVATFEQGMSVKLRGDKRLLKIIDYTEELFYNRPYPNLFGASDFEELKSAYREAYAVYDGCIRSVTDKASATPQVLELIQRARECNPEYPKEAEQEVLKIVRQLKSVLRKNG